MRARLLPAEEKESVTFFCKYCRTHLASNSLYSLHITLSTARKGRRGSAYPYQRPICKNSERGEVQGASSQLPQGAPHASMPTKKLPTILLEIILTGGRDIVLSCTLSFTGPACQPFRVPSACPPFIREMAQDYNNYFRLAVRKTVLMDTGRETLFSEADQEATGVCPWNITFCYMQDKMAIETIA